MLKRYKKVTDERTDWAVIGPLGAVQFWKFNRTAGGYNLGGVEEHRHKPFPYSPDAAPSQSHCFLLDAPCWHDGSSLYADHFFPLLQLGSDDAIYHKLEDEYHCRLESSDDEA